MLSLLINSCKYFETFIPLLGLSAMKARFFRKLSSSGRLKDILEDIIGPQ